MADRGLINETPFAAQELYLADEEGRDLLVVVVQATYRISQDSSLSLAEEQLPVETAGTYHGEPGTSSYRYEPQVAPVKLATDVVLLGHAFPERPGATHVDVRFRVGPVGKVIRVFGDRQWYGRSGYAAISDPQPFDKMPLVYDRAFGGWDRSPADPDQHTVEARNPVGVGYHNKKLGTFIDGAPLPNLEDPRQLIKGYYDAPPPAAFGFVGPDWAPRAQYAGTYDEAWRQHRMPLLPQDFDRRFFNAASLDLVAPGYLRGDEYVLLVNAVPEGNVQFYLPGEPSPQCTVTLKTQASHAVQMQLDTVIVNADDRRLSLIWRGHMLVPDRRLHDIRAIRVEPNPMSMHAPQDRIAVAVS